MMMIHWQTFTVENICQKKCLDSDYVLRIFVIANKVLVATHDPYKDTYRGTCEKMNNSDVAEYLAQFRCERQ